MPSTLLDRWKEAYNQASEAATAEASDQSVLRQFLGLSTEHVLVTYRDTKLNTTKARWITDPNQWDPETKTQYAYLHLLKEHIEPITDKPFFPLLDALSMRVIEIEPGLFQPHYTKRFANALIKIQLYYNSQTNEEQIQRNIETTIGTIPIAEDHRKNCTTEPIIDFSERLPKITPADLKIIADVITQESSQPGGAAEDSTENKIKDYIRCLKVWHNLIDRRFLVTEDQETNNDFLTQLFSKPKVILLFEELLQDVKYTKKGRTKGVIKINSSTVPGFTINADLISFLCACKDEDMHNVVCELHRGDSGYLRRVKNTRFISLMHLQHDAKLLTSLQSRPNIDITLSEYLRCLNHIDFEITGNCKAGSPVTLQSMQQTMTVPDQYYWKAQLRLAYFIASKLAANHENINDLIARINSDDTIIEDATARKMIEIIYISSLANIHFDPNFYPHFNAEQQDDLFNCLIPALFDRISGTNIEAGGGGSTGHANNSILNKIKFGSKLKLEFLLYKVVQEHLKREDTTPKILIRKLQELFTAWGIPEAARNLLINLIVHQNKHQHEWYPKGELNGSADPAKEELRQHELRFTAELIQYIAATDWKSKTTATAEEEEESAATEEEEGEREEEESAAAEEGEKPRNTDIEKHIAHLQEKYPRWNERQSLCPLWNQRQSFVVTQSTLARYVDTYRDAMAAIPAPTAIDDSSKAKELSQPDEKALAKEQQLAAGSLLPPPAVASPLGGAEKLSKRDYDKKRAKGQKLAAADSLPPPAVAAPLGGAEKRGNYDNKCTAEQQEPKAAGDGAAVVVAVVAAVEESAVAAEEPAWKSDTFLSRMEWLSFFEANTPTHQVTAVQPSQQQAVTAVPVTATIVEMTEPPMATVVGEEGGMPITPVVATPLDTKSAAAATLSCDL